MKNALLIISTALLTSLSTIYFFKKSQPGPAFEQQSVMPVKYISDNSAYDKLIQGRVQERFHSAYPTNFTEAAARVTPAVVNIQAFPKGFFFSNYGGSSGSGVIVSPDGYIVTNNHVIEEAPNDIEVTLFDNREYPAKLIGTDPSTDLALIKVEVDEPLPHVIYSNSDSVMVGEWVLAVGNPFNLASTVTAGIVSAKGRDIDILTGEYKIESFIQTDAAVNPGNSGGALVNTNGELIGINTAIVTRSGRYEGYSFAVPVNLARKVINDLKEFGEVKRAILGVRISDLSSDRAKRVGLERPEGVVIASINPNSAAEDAGLKSQDIILAINGKPIRSVPELQENVARFRPGDEVKVTFLRDGEKRMLPVTLKDLNNSILAPAEAISQPMTEEELSEQLDWNIRELSRADARQLGISGGVQVTGIGSESVLLDSNMEPGFVITKISQYKEDELGITELKQFPVTNAEDLDLALREIGRGKVLLEGIYEGYEDEWGYTFELK